MKIELPVNQIREIIESIEWIADEFEGYHDMEDDELQSTN